jgi:hypothetical protein
VKRSNADGSVVIRYVRVGQHQGFIHRPPIEKSIGGFLFSSLKISTSTMWIFSLTGKDPLFYK